jgi:hypothetical protein
VIAARVTTDHTWEGSQGQREAGPRPHTTERDFQHRGGWLVRVDGPSAIAIETVGGMAESCTARKAIKRCSEVNNRETPL